MERILKENFEEIFEIITKSFPPDEYREKEKQRAVFDNRYYNVYGYRDANGGICAFVSLWDFEDFIYVEHLAVNPKLRSSGLGSGLLGEILSRTDKIICLEVEPSGANIMADRRIGFYHRNGFFSNPYPYVQPVYDEGKNPLELMIMTSQREISQAEFENFRRKIYKEVYGKII